MIYVIDQFLSIIGFYASISLITFVIYGFDKRAAEKQKQRVSENMLHLLAVVGGWPGALLAQRYWRHKTRKQPFRIVFWVTVAANLGLLVWLLWPAQ
ncbi:DUF1294 domain-containing protein [Kordiimonas aquimaris]|uniref:DUF1294 domain-containing protein n=1 Tax=Kordiimonas aquimaris TaxID=707591 RepID=UPI0021CE1AD3|nr:DUF1294 domain-containing protein [Kordiimonas aquimaris]